MFKALSQWLERRRARAAELQAAERAEAEAKLVWQKAQRLGRWRVLSLEYTGGNRPTAYFYFNPPEDIDIFTAYRDHASRIWDKFHEKEAGNGLADLALLRVLSGELDFADLIVDNLPAKPTRFENARGVMFALPQYAMANILPLPETLKERPHKTWLAGSQVQADVRAWLKEHHDKLKWHEKEGVYREAE